MPPTTRADGTALTDLAAYKIYFGISSGNYTQSIDVGNVTSYTVTNLSTGTAYYFATTAYDASNNESSFSNEVSKTIAAVVTYCCDKDKDGYISTTIDGTCSGTGCEPIGCQTTAGNDCNDSNSAINPDTLWYPDADGDNYGDRTIAYQQCTPPSGPPNYVLDNTDFNDNDPNIYGIPIKIEGESPSYFLTLQAAYNAAIDGDIMQVQAVTFSESLTINIDKSVTFEGGYNGAYSIITGDTTLQGDIDITNGTLTIEDFILE
jgi:hypothetical protein